MLDIYLRIADNVCRRKQDVNFETTQGSRTINEDNMKDQLLKRIEEKQTMIMIYSDRDHTRVNQLASELHGLQMMLLDIMTLENEYFLEASKGL